MTTTVTINGNSIVFNRNARVTYNIAREVDYLAIQYTTKVISDDNVTTQKTVDVSVNVSDGEDGNTINDWVDKIEALFPSGTITSGSVKIDTSYGTALLFSFSAIESATVGFDDTKPTELSIKLRLRRFTRLA